MQTFEVHSLLMLVALINAMPSSIWSQNYLTQKAAMRSGQCNRYNTHNWHNCKLLQAAIQSIFHNCQSLQPVPDHDAELPRANDARQRQLAGQATGRGARVGKDPVDRLELRPCNVRDLAQAPDIVVHLLEIPCCVCACVCATMCAHHAAP